MCSRMESIHVNITYMHIYIYIHMTYDINKYMDIYVYTSYHLYHVYNHCCRSRRSHEKIRDPT